MCSNSRTFTRLVDIPKLYGWGPSNPHFKEKEGQRDRGSTGSDVAREMSTYEQGIKDEGAGREGEGESGRKYSIKFISMASFVP